MKSTVYLMSRTQVTYVQHLGQYFPDFILAIL
ncbi:hypothetical protein predicted by Glimmer/Critica [Streptococcus dysgalactiae subsp. equisimilis AC-2713]|uniref:Transposase n=1 Tax=Streptococcus dysgalactiae subsp. equisimilis AC-2713 TaxID=759913 RepID=A0AB33R5S0_STREQ|nr:hypothetical protein predicted by Glimmer/Critica [Streptococcus dysgalactiae subsp. equisimilis AC-2713]